MGGQPARRGSNDDVAALIAMRYELSETDRTAGRNRLACILVFGGGD